MDVPKAVPGQRPIQRTQTGMRVMGKQAAKLRIQFQLQCGLNSHFVELVSHYLTLASILLEPATT